MARSLFNKSFPEIEIPVSTGDTFPTELEIAIEQLRSQNGDIDFSFSRQGDDECLEITSENARYLVVTNNKMLVDHQTPLTDAMTYMGRGESLVHNTVDDIDAVKRMVLKFVANGTFNDEYPFAWVDLSSDEAGRRFDFDGHRGT